MNYKLRSLIAATLAGSVLMGFGANAMADSTDDILNALIAKGVLTEEEGALLMKGREGEKEAAAKKKDSGVSAKFKDGLAFESGDGTFKAQINGRVHEDYRTYDYSNSENNKAPTGAGNSTPNVNNIADTWDMRRARIGFKASYKEFYEGEVVADLSNSSTTIDVANLNVAWWKPVQFKFGQFKMPMNLEELTSSNNIDFMERSFVNQLAPAKEIGAMVHGSPFVGTTYGLAISNGSGKNLDTDMREDGKDFVGRGTINFAEIMDNKDMILHAGVSYSNGEQANTAGSTTVENTIGVSGRTESRGATFFTAPKLKIDNNAYETIDRTRQGLEGIVAYNQFKFQTEWMQQSNDFDTKKDSYDLDIDNYYAEAMWLISGEKYADFYKGGAMGAIKPAKDFNPADFSGGVWEVGFRVSEFDASDYNTTGIGKGVGAADAGVTQAFGFSKAKGYTTGIKFYPNANMRFMLNYVQTDFDDAIGGATGGIIVNQKREDEEKAVIMRAQWMF